MKLLQNLYKQVAVATSDESFLNLLKKVETLVAKVLSLAMVVVLLVSVVDLCLFLASKLFLASELFSEPTGFFTTTLIELFGLFLNILIALEVLENITAYLRKHVIQLELVIVTSLTAIARKIIIFDFSKATGIDLIGLALGIFALSLSYWIIRRTAKSPQSHD